MSALRLGKCSFGGATGFHRAGSPYVAEPAAREGDAFVLLRDRLYVGYVEKTAMLEVLSYNEVAGRFELQIVKDYRPGGQPKVFYANRAICISCHQNHAPIFSEALWRESNASSTVSALIRAQRGDLDLSPQANIDFPGDTDRSTVRANTLVTLQRAWQQGGLETHLLHQGRSEDTGRTVYEVHCAAVHDV